jgi:hypothetical protein
MSLLTPQASATSKAPTSANYVVTHIHDLNKNIASSRVAFFGLLIVLYILLSIAFFSGFEKMSILDAVYYAIITMATVCIIA